MQQARMILAVVLSMAVFFVYYTYIDPPKAPQEVQATNQAQIKDESASQAPASSMPVSEAGLARNIPSFSAKGEEFVLENESVKLVIDSLGGQIEGLYLKKYPKEKGEEPVNLVEHGGGLGGLSFSSSLKDFEVPYNKIAGSQDQILLEGLLGDLSVKKSYRLSPQSLYGFEEEIEIVNRGSQVLDLEPQFWMVRHQKASPKKGFLSFLAGPPDIVHPLGMVGKSFSMETDPAKFNQFGPLMGPVSWLGYSDRYFMTGFISSQPAQSGLGRFFTAGSEQLYVSYTYGELALNPGETITKKVGLYLGPKLRSELKLLNAGLEQSVDYGWFSFVAVPLLWLLIFLEKLIQNWGLAIIALTFIVKMLLHPVNKKSMESMKAMQKLQPRLKEIQQKYKGDREKLNAEMMILFKSHKVNPMGGCLPLLLQMPIYIALYKVLWNAVELYKAPFFGIYKDLSAPDPLFIGPILLGVLFYLQQKLMPQSTSMDPAQQKVMQFMPFMFIPFMAFLPAGLILYILVNTLMSVVQQYMIHREISLWGLVKSKMLG